MAAEHEIEHHHGFDAHLFWVEHRSKIVLAILLVLLAVVAYAIQEYTVSQRERGAGRSLATADTTQKLRGLIERYPSTDAAGAAHLLLAKQLRDDKKFDDAVATLEEFRQKFPKHPLVHAGVLSLAETFQLMGKNEDALRTYQEVVTQFPQTSSAPAALLGEAALFKSLEKPDDTRRAYESLIAQFPESVYTQEAMRGLRTVRK